MLQSRPLYLLLTLYAMLGFQLWHYYRTEQHAIEAAAHQKAVNCRQYTLMCLQDDCLHFASPYHPKSKADIKAGLKPVNMCRLCFEIQHGGPFVFPPGMIVKDETDGLH